MRPALVPLPSGGGPRRTREVFLGLALALLLVGLDLGRLVGGALEPARRATPVVEGWRELPHHRVFAPLPAGSERVLMFGACQVSGLHCHFAAPLDREGRCSTPHQLEALLSERLGRPIEVDNLGMDGTGYLTSAYFILETLDAPGARVVVHSVAQGGNYFLTGDPKVNERILVLVAPLRQRIARLVPRFPGVPELGELDRALDRMEDDARGRGLLPPGVTARRGARTAASEPGFWRRRTAFLPRALFLWLRRFRDLPRTLEPKRSVDEILHGFEPRFDAALRDEPVPLDPTEVLLHRALARVLAAERKTYVVVHPPDLDVQQDGGRTARLWWDPLEAALADLPNVVLWDLHALPMERGRDMYNHVQRTYHGNRKEAEAMLPLIMDLLERPAAASVAPPPHPG